MKFELEPNNRGVADETLLEDLRKVASALQKTSVTKNEYMKHGRFSPATLQNRFGGWCKANGRAGLSKNRNFGISPSDCICSITSVAQHLGKNTLTTEEYLSNGGLSLTLASHRI